MLYNLLFKPFQFLIYLICVSVNLTRRYVRTVHLWYGVALILVLLSVVARYVRKCFRFFSINIHVRDDDNCIYLFSSCREYISKQHWQPRIKLIPSKLYILSISLQKEISILFILLICYPLYTQYFVQLTYFFSTMANLTLLVLISLGWSILRAFISRREKEILGVSLFIYFVLGIASGSCINNGVSFCTTNMYIYSIQFDKSLIIFCFIIAS